MSERSVHSDAALASVQAELALQAGDVPAAVTHWRLAAQADDASPWIRVRLGEALLLVGDARGAIAAADRAIALCGDGKDDMLERAHGMAAWRMRSVAQRVLGDDDGAADSLRTVLAQQPGEARASALLLQLLVDRDALAEAEAVAASWTTTDGVAGLVTLARAFAAHGQHAPALRQLQAALERAPDDDNALDAQRVLLLALGRFDEALEVTRRLVSVRDDDSAFSRSHILTALALTHVDEARALARAWLADDGSERMRLLVADALTAAGLLEDAVVALGPSTPSTSTLLRLEVARLRLEARQFDDPDAACALHSDDGRLEEYAHLLCAQARADRGDVGTAVRQLLSTGPVISARRLSRVASLLKRATGSMPDVEALIQAQRALHDDDDNSANTNALSALSVQERLEHAAAVAAALGAVGAFDDANALLAAHLTAHPAHPELQLAHAKLRLAQHPDDVEVAVAPLRLAAAHEATVGALNFIAFSLADADVDVANAVRFAWQAVLQDPLNGFVLDTLGWAQLKAAEATSPASAPGAAPLATSPDVDTAIATLRRAARLVPHEAEVWWHLASAELRRGHLDEAIAAGRQAEALLLPGDGLRARVEALLATAAQTTASSP
jgi:tetratricopeptide (TPR) repeat protein